MNGSTVRATPALQLSPTGCPARAAPHLVSARRPSAEARSFAGRRARPRDGLLNTLQQQPGGSWQPTHAIMHSFALTALALVEYVLRGSQWGNRGTTASSRKFKCRHSRIAGPHCLAQGMQRARSRMAWPRNECPRPQTRMHACAGIRRRWQPSRDALVSPSRGTAAILTFPGCRRQHGTKV